MDQATAKGSQWLVFSLSCGPSPLGQCSLGIISFTLLHKTGKVQNKLEVSIQDKHLVKVPEAVFCDEDWLPPTMLEVGTYPSCQLFVSSLGILIDSWFFSHAVETCKWSWSFSVKQHFSGFFSKDKVKATPISRKLIFLATLNSSMLTSVSSVLKKLVYEENRTHISCASTSIAPNLWLHLPL
jgi:hypothetical protein